MINDHEIKLKPYLSPVGAWAFSLGTSIGWIVDVTTLGATLIYGIVAASAYKIAKNSDNKS